MPSPNTGFWQRARRWLVRRLIAMDAMHTLDARPAPQQSEARLAPTEPAAIAMHDPLDTYARGTLGAQAAVDIFKGVWSSELPAALGVHSGGAKLFEDPRIQWMLDQLGGIAHWRVLELGPLEGGHSSMLQAAGAGQVLAMDACAMSYLKCLIVKDLCKLTQVDFQYGDFMTYLEQSGPGFDLVVASGVLYHQRDPVACLQRMAARSDRLFIWTHYYTDDLHTEHLRADMFTPVPAGTVGGLAQGFNGTLFRLNYEAYLPGVKYRGGVDDHTHWMRREDILACLQQCGLTDIRIAFDQQEHPFAANFALLAQRPGAGDTPDTPPEASPASLLDYRAQMRALGGPEPWCIDAIRLYNGVLEVSGWAIPPAGVIGRMGFVVNGQTVAALECGLPRPDVGSFYWFYPASGYCGFALRHPIATIDDKPLHLQYIDIGTGQTIAPQHDFYAHPQDLRGESPAPPLALVQRTHTGNSADQYFVEGTSIYYAIANAFLEATGQPLSTAGTVLDFGCGPGRLTRHLLREPGLRVVGVDVDPACVDWCREHLGAARFMAGPLHPPLTLETASVDCVLAIAVMQHLREEDGLQWLAEWVRICKPGGYLLVSIASDLALTRARLSEAHYASIRGYAVVELSRNPDLDGVIADTDYYKNVLHSHAHIHSVWPSLGVEVLRIVPGCIGNHHDLVVLRCKR
ncbi:MAG: hypothetical protein CFE43_08895 [Burkholderiales bacterium PBB3]|nr:MAG: hypothetical protein CFE43_08895 [Burkholderiales bacterium PBB3]